MGMRSPYNARTLNDMLAKMEPEKMFTRSFILHRQLLRFYGHLFYFVDKFCYFCFLQQSTLAFLFVADAKDVRCFMGYPGLGWYFILSGWQFHTHGAGQFVGSVLLAFGCTKSKGIWISLAAMIKNVSGICCISMGISRSFHAFFYSVIGVVVLSFGLSFCYRIS